MRTAKDDADEYGGVYALDYLIRRTTTAHRKRIINDAFTMTRSMSHAGVPALAARRPYALSS